MSAPAARHLGADWEQSVGLCDALHRSEPSAVIELSRAVAITTRDAPAAGSRRSMRS